MMKKSIYFTLAGMITLGTILTFFLNPDYIIFLWIVISLFTWVLPLGFRNTAEKTEENRENPDEERVRKDYHGIPGYEKSSLDIKGCYNCYFSKDIGNQTFVECKNYSQKVYRHHICDTYKS